MTLQLLHQGSETVTTPSLWGRAIPIPLSSAASGRARRSPRGLVDQTRDPRNLFSKPYGTTCLWPCFCRIIGLGILLKPALAWRGTEFIWHHLRQAEANTGGSRAVSQLELHTLLCGLCFSGNLQAPWDPSVGVGAKAAPCASPPCSGASFLVRCL